MRQFRNAIAWIAPILITSVTSAQTNTEQDIATIPLMPTDWSESRSLPQFDPSLGTLLSISLMADATVTGLAGFESMDMTPSVVSLDWRAEIRVRRADNGSILAMASPQFQDTVNLQAFDGVIDMAGPSGQSFPNLNETASDAQQFFAPFTPEITNLFVGAGTFDVEVDALGLSRATGPGNLIAQFATNAAATITVVYEYQGVIDCNNNDVPDEDDISNGTSLDCNLNNIPDECEFDCNDNGIPDDCDPEECPCFEFNRREPGSLLLFPEYRNGPGRVTLFSITNTNCESALGSTSVEFRYITKETCSESNQETFLTPCDTFTFLTSSHSGVGEGYAYAYAEKVTSTPANPSGEPQVFNHLIGQLVVVDGWDLLDYSMNAVSFKGIGLERAPTDRDGVNGLGDGVRDLNNEEYEPAPDRLYIPRFLGQDVGLRPQVRSELILVNLSGGSSFVSSPANLGGGTTIRILGYNDNEVAFWTQYTFSCWDRVPLTTLSSAFGNTSLRGTNDDPNEIEGAMGREAGWFIVNGVTASSTVETINDPALYAVLVEKIRGRSASDLPFEFCSQLNGDLLPRSIFGDFPSIAGDNQ